jgi:exodeoxyribonuclease VII large subunit
VQPLTVTELTAAIQSLLEPPFRGVSVQGEISNCKAQSSGHLYFSLKDAGAQISAVLFKGSQTKLATLPKEGDQIIATGELSVYAPRGQYQLIVRELQFLGLGELLLKFHQLKELLHKRGWFEPKRKKKLPQLPKRIGVVTSPTGAVIQDILHVLTRRFQGVQVVLNPVKVQGEGAAEEIASAIVDFNRYQLADVLIVGRGGGSIEDLWAFNEESVARAIFESTIPVISAVGHETDTTLADWVADVRAPTPSAAAEIVMGEKANLVKFLHQSASYLSQKISGQVLSLRQKLNSLQKHPLFCSPYALLAQPLQRIDAFQERCEQSVQRQIQERKRHLLSLSRQLQLLDPAEKIIAFKARLKELQSHILKRLSEQLLRKGERTRSIEEHLRTLNPRNLLQKGYAIVFEEKSSSVILSVAQLTPEQKITILLHDGQVDAAVHNPRKNL